MRAGQYHMYRVDENRGVDHRNVTVAPGLLLVQELPTAEPTGISGAIASR